jgi:hypothetical protein
MSVLTVLTEGRRVMGSAAPEPDLAAAGYVESEWLLAGEADSYRAVDTPADGRWEVTEAGTSPYATRIVVRRPSDPSAFSGTGVVEWLNVSSGEDASPDWTYLAEEIVRAGHLYVGVSAQHVGVEGGQATVTTAGPQSRGLKGRKSPRYQGLHHPGDAYCYGIYTEALQAVRGGEGPFTGLVVDRVVAVGESQSAYALTTYVNAVQPRTGAADAFLVHSRGGAPLPLGERGRAIDLNQVRYADPVLLRDDLGLPVLVVETETDLLSPRINYLPARQDDSAFLRTWEVAGTAHADRYQVGEFEKFLGCPDPVNTGQQVYVLRAALRALLAWLVDGVAAPAAQRLELSGPDAFVTDSLGNARGGVRTPVVDAAVVCLSGLAAPDASVICSLFGRTLPVDADVLAARYDGVDAYLAEYAAATDAAIAAGFVCVEDRDAVLGEARPEVLAL